MESTISVGAVGAALIGALITVVGLIISKENKTSEFRQDWINKLRDEIRNFLVSFNAIADASARRYGTAQEKLEVLSPMYSSLNASLFAISLRLNPKEEESIEFINAANELVSLTRQPNAISAEAIRPLESRLQIAAKALLKKEWKRVKRGEPFFLLLKWGGMATVFATLVMLIWQPDFISERFFAKKQVGEEAAVSNQLSKPNEKSP